MKHRVHWSGNMHVCSGRTHPCPWMTPYGPTSAHTTPVQPPCNSHATTHNTCTHAPKSRKSSSSSSASTKRSSCLGPLPTRLCPSSLPTGPAVAPTLSLSGSDRGVSAAPSSPKASSQFSSLSEGKGWGGRGKEKMSALLQWERGKGQVTEQEVGGQRESSRYSIKGWGGA